MRGEHLPVFVENRYDRNAAVQSRLHGLYDVVELCLMVRLEQSAITGGTNANADRACSDVLMSQVPGACTRCLHRLHFDDLTSTGLVPPMAVRSWLSLNIPAPAYLISFRTPDANSRYDVESGGIHKN